MGVGSGAASPAPLHAAEDGDPNPPCANAPLPATPGQGPDELDKLFWFNAGFFHETRQRFFLAREANEPTRMMCKAVVVEVLAGAVKPPPEGVLDGEPAAAGEWIRTHINDLLTEDMSLSGAEALWRWGEQVGLPRVRQKNSPEDAEQWGVWVHEMVHWEWVTRKLRWELERHGDRAGNRALELACGAPFEHVERKLGDFVGTLKEMFLRFTQAL